MNEGEGQGAYDEPFRVLLDGAGLVPTVPRELVVASSAREVEALFARLGAPAPHVDLGRERVVGLLIGTAPDTSWSARVLSVRTDAARGTTTLRWEATSTGGLALEALTSLFVVVAIPARGTAVVADPPLVPSGPPDRTEPHPPPDPPPARAPRPGTSARWRFDRLRPDGTIPDESGAFVASCLGMHETTTARGPGLAWRGDGEALRLPVELFLDAEAGTFSTWLRRDVEGAVVRLLGVVDPGVFSEIGVHIDGDGLATFQTGQRGALRARLDLPPGALRHLAFSWGPGGRRIFVDGALVAHEATPARTGPRSRLAELGRDPNNPARTGSRGTLVEVAVHRGELSADAIARLAAGG